jgi:hypothetical protein
VPCPDLLGTARTLTSHSFVIRSDVGSLSLWYGGPEKVRLLPSTNESRCAQISTAGADRTRLDAMEGTLGLASTSPTGIHAKIVDTMTENPARSLVTVCLAAPHQPWRRGRNGTSSVKRIISIPSLPDEAARVRASFRTRRRAGVLIRTCCISARSSTVPAAGESPQTAGVWRCPSRGIARVWQATPTAHTHLRSMTWARQENDDAQSGSSPDCPFCQCPRGNSDHRAAAYLSGCRTWQCQPRRHTRQHRAAPVPSARTLGKSRMVIFNQKRAEQLLDSVGLNLGDIPCASSCDQRQVERVLGFPNQSEYSQSRAFSRNEASEFLDGIGDGYPICRIAIPSV